jgi:hypothetical protein
MDRRETVGPLISYEEGQLKEIPSIPHQVPMLSTKLQEYWELSQSQRSLGLAGRSGTNPPVNSASGFSHAPTNILPDRSIDNIAGQQPVEKLKGFTSGMAPRTLGMNVRASSNSDLLPNVEIQNTFHVNVNNESGELGSLGEFSDKIADILREQALQHGIDIT